MWGWRDVAGFGESASTNVDAGAREGRAHHREIQSVSSRGGGERSGCRDGRARREGEKPNRPVGTVAGSIHEGRTRARRGGRCGGHGAKERATRGGRHVALEGRARGEL